MYVRRYVQSAVEFLSLGSGPEGVPTMPSVIFTKVINSFFSSLKITLFTYSLEF